MVTINIDGKFIGVALVIVLVAGIGFFAIDSLKPKATGYSTALPQKAELFTGKITNMNLEPGKYEGTGVYDKSCIDAGAGMTECDGGIKTDKGVLNFHYKHNMAILPCIAPGDGLIVEVLDSEGNARVTRTSSGGSH